MIPCARCSFSSRAFALHPFSICPQLSPSHPYLILSSRFRKTTPREEPEENFALLSRKIQTMNCHPPLSSRFSLCSKLCDPHMIRIDWCEDQRELFLVEMQGTLAIAKDSEGESGTVEIGSLNQDPAKPKKCALHIGTQVCEGDVSQLKRPILVVKRIPAERLQLPVKRIREKQQNCRVEKDDPSCDGSRPSAASSCAQLFEDWMMSDEGQRQCNPAADDGERDPPAYEIVGVARQQFLFSGKPMRIFEKPKPPGLP